MKHCLKCNELNNNSAAACSGCSAPLSGVEKLEDGLRPEDRQRFKFVAFAGEGSFGRVYRCQDTRLQKLVAVKLIKPECLSNELFIDLFKRECEFSKNIGEEHLVSTLDYCVTEEYAYSVMEFIEGVELSSYLKSRRSLTLEEFKKIAVQIANGLHFFHYHGLLHCDLKPSNIMINPETLKLKIVDFGLSHFKFEENILEKDMIGGTRGYMSPEQEAGIKALTAASDIYSVGVIYYETLTGTRPEFDDAGEPVPPSAFCDVLLAAADENYFSDESVDLDQISRDVVNIIDYLDLVVLRCLQKEPRSRFKTIDELRTVIEKAGHDFKLDIVIEKTAAATAYAQRRQHPVPEPPPPESAGAADGSRHQPEPPPKKEGSAIKKIKQSTLVTRIMQEPAQEEPKTSKTLLLKYNKPRPGQGAPDARNGEAPKHAAAGGAAPQQQSKPSTRAGLVDDRPRRKGTVYKSEPGRENSAVQYAAAIITIAAVAAAYLVYSKFLN